jgi:hypothetical protein
MLFFRGLRLFGAGTEVRLYQGLDRNEPDSGGIRLSEIIGAAAVTAVIRPTRDFLLQRDMAIDS